MVSFLLLSSVCVYPDLLYFTYNLILVRVQITYLHVQQKITFSHKATVTFMYWWSFNALFLCITQGHQQCIISVLRVFLQSASALLQGIIYLMPANFQLPCLTWNALGKLLRKFHQWPQSNYISRPACCPCVCVCLQCGCCVHDNGILSPPSWSYQSLAELRGVGKVIHTTGGSIHPADSPQCCLHCLLDSLQASKDNMDPLSLVLGFLCVFSLGKGSVEVRGRCHSLKAAVTFPCLYFHSWARSWDGEWVRRDREEGLHRMSSTSSLSPWLLMPSCRAGSLCFITVRRLS